jgi:large subunit ribosomal protein L23
MNIIIKKPIITEKSMKLASRGIYTFLVARNSRKPEIIKTVEEKFGVKVVAIKTANYKDEIKSQRGRRGSFCISGFKKAVVELEKGQKIALFES